MSIRIVIADDHTLLREGLCRILEFEDDIEVIGEVGDGQGAINLARRLDLDVLLIDLNMPIVSGLEACRVIRREKPNVGIIILTVDDSEDKVFRVLQLGVASYLLKDVDSKMLIDSIRKVYACSPLVSSAMLTSAHGETTDLPLHKKQTFGLSDRELEILGCVVKGSSNKEIGHSLFISEKTVKNHLSSIFRKLLVEDRTQAALKAVKLELVALE
ncbi:MAG: response regulator transcription factor [Peptococcaceae bacterium]|jgi:two-component system NarL family response regulator|nr:response regulator transcription factor [Peptococcaceae bacterium]